MIKIDNENIDSIAEKFYKGVKDIIFNLSKFHVAALRLINGDPTVTFDTMTGDFAAMSIRTITANLKFLLAANQTFTSRAHWPLLLVKTNIHPYYLTHNAYLIALLTELQDEKKLKPLLLGKPGGLLRTESTHQFMGWDNIFLKPLLNQVINYDDFTSKDKYPYDAYTLANELQVNICPYCNRSYTSTINAPDKITRPTFDHFFDKARHPLLVLSFFNLIPSCSLCNSYLKGAIPFRLNTHLHPYLDGYGKDVRFDYDQKTLHPDKSHPSNFRIRFTWNTPAGDAKHRRVKGNIKIPNSGNMTVFKTEEIYQTHADVVGEIVIKADANSPYYAKTLRGIFDTIGTTDEEFYRYYFGNYYKEIDFNKRPLAKLTKDLVVKLLPEFAENALVDIAPE